MLRAAVLVRTTVQRHTAQMNTILVSSSHVSICSVMVTSFLGVVCGQTTKIWFSF